MKTVLPISSITWMVCLLLFHTSVVAQNGNEKSNASVQAKSLFTEPSLSADGTEIVFVSGGDIWTVPLQGGPAHLLVSHADHESRPLYSPDGRYLAFTSTRTGNGDVYVMEMESGSLKRFTYDDANEEVSAWSGDGKYIYFSSGSQDISGMSDVFRVSAAGGTAMPVADERYTNEFFAAPSPDGTTLAFNARGIASRQWWRNGHSHLDESQIWLRQEAKTISYKPLTEGGAKELWPMWNKEGNAIYYVSDRDGIQNLWSRSLSGSAKQLTSFKDGRVLWPSISYDGKTIVFERDFSIWKYDIASNQATQISITKRGAAAGPATQHLKLTSQFSELVLSPDGKKAAFVAHGEVFAASATDGGDAMRISNTVESETNLAWSPDSRRLVYASNRDDAAHLYIYDFATRTETRLTNAQTDDALPVFSPDGRFIAFQRDGKELRILELASKKENLLYTGYIGRPRFDSKGSIVWSPDSKWIAFASSGVKNFRNVSLVRATGGEVKPISFLANTFGGNASWSPDGKYILMGTSQRTENSQIARIDLLPRTPVFQEDRFRDLFKEEMPGTTPDSPGPATLKPAKSTNAPKDTILTAAKGAKPAIEPVKIDFADIRQRLSLLPIGMDINEQTISRDGKNLLMIATVAGQENVYVYSLDELDKEPPVAKQVTSTSGSKSDAQFSADGKDIFYLEQGRIYKVAVDGKTPKPIAVTAEMDVDFSREKMEVFRQAWDIQYKNFYDTTFHGADWKAIRKRYQPLAAGTHTSDELRRLINLMVGELNASHSGISAPPSTAQSSTGRIGLRFDKEEYESTGKLKVTEVVPLSPAALAGNIKPGDYLVAIDDTELSRTTNLESLLQNKINRRVSLTVSTSATGKDRREVSVRPVNLSTEKELRYRNWVQEQREYVAKASGGRLGYVHMYDMSSESLNQLYLDLDIENHAKEGVVVDVRNNNGGFVNAYAIDVFARKGYMNMTWRGLPTSPARSQLGQRALEAPTILVTNQHSLSDAEDFTEGYRALKLGKVVGEPTAGWIIYTSGVQLIDGSMLRLPFIKVTDGMGKNMELAPRPVDVAVSRQIGESYAKKDSQLDVAVKELLNQLGEKKQINKTGEGKKGE